MRAFAQSKWTLGFIGLFLIWLVFASFNLISGPDRTEGRDKQQSNSTTPLNLTTHYVERDGSQGEALVGIAISGGGSRAANFAASVMAELDRMGLLRKVTAISSVSGGSVAASYFVVKSQEPQYQDRDAFWAKAKQTLSQNFRSDWAIRTFLTHKLFETGFTGTTRTDVMADIFDEAFLRKATFKNVANKSPALIIDATVINDQPDRLVNPNCVNRGNLAQRLRWESISFTDDFFHHCLNASSDKFPISTAVAASAAFPGLFNSVSLKRFNGTSKEPDFVHLIDGGPSDNLGMDGILGLLVSPYKQPTKKPTACLLIVIDAFAMGDPDSRNEQPDIRGALSRTVDMNFFDSIDAMLARRRYDTLQRLDLPPVRQEDRFGGFLLRNNYPLTGQEYPILRSSRRFNPSVPASRAMGEQPDLLGVHCAVWHIALENIPSLMAGQGIVNGKLEALYQSGSGNDQVQLKDWFARPEVPHRIETYELASRLRTDFNLSGPKLCNREQLADGVWEAGRVAVRDDLESRMAVCEWARNRGWIMNEACDASPIHRPSSLKIELVARNKGSRGFDVKCSSADLAIESSQKK